MYLVIKKMVACVECGKRLRFFNGYNHPIFEKKSLVCGPCLLRVDESVARWREFVLSNSFNPESYKPTLGIDWSSFFKKVKGIRKKLTRTKENKSYYYSEQRKTCKRTVLVPPRIIAMVFMISSSEM